MDLRKARRWHWVLISLALGLLLAAARQWADANGPLNVYGESINDPDVFEAALVDSYSGVRRFKDITVYPVYVDEGGGRTRPVHVVSGSYFSGRAETSDGQQLAVWRPGCFIAPVPFQPSAGDGDGDRPHRTVLDFLDGLKGKGVSYRYVWWREARWRYPFWVAGSLLLVGGVWPTVLNLVLFGSIFRPREEKGTDLSRVRPGISADQRPTDGPDLSEIETLVAGMEVGLSKTEGTGAPQPLLQAQGASPQEKPVLQLSPSESETPAAAGMGEQKDFGADGDDFYPTELKGRSHRDR